MSLNRQKLHLATRVTRVCILSWAWAACKEKNQSVPEAPSSNFFVAFIVLLKPWLNGKSSVHTQAKIWNQWRGMWASFWSLLFGQRRTAEFSLVFLSVLLGLSRGETKTSKLAKIAFMGQETVRKQHRHNLNGNSRTSITRTSDYSN